MVGRGPHAIKVDVLKPWAERRNALLEVAPGDDAKALLGDVHAAVGSAEE
jgi:hypothetical protein